MTDLDRQGGYTPRRATRFFLPLLVQAFSQSLTYPLVGAIVTHGEYGVDTLTAFAQALCLMFLIGSIGGGMMLTGMVFARSRRGYRAFVRLNTIMMIALGAVQILAALPPFDALIFRKILNLPPHLADIAAQTLLWSIVMETAFFLRNVPLVILLNARAGTEANLATFVRIVITALTPCVFIPLGLTGAMWGLAATTGPCVVEFLLSQRFARKYVDALPETDGGEDVSAAAQFRFSVPISFGSVLLSAAPFMVAAFVGRAADATAMLAIHYVTVGVANPVGYASLRMQPVAVQFPPEHPGDRRVLRYAVCAGLLLAFIPLTIAAPFISGKYFCGIQNLAPEHLARARAVMACFAAWPVIQCVRGYAEGLAAWLKKPSTVLCGQLAYLGSLVAILYTELVCGMPGCYMGMSAIVSASLIATASMILYLRKTAAAAAFTPTAHG